MIWRDLHPFRARLVDLSTHIEFLAQINKRSGFSIFITSAFEQKCSSKKLSSKIILKILIFEKIDFFDQKIFDRKNVV